MRKIITAGVSALAFLFLGAGAVLAQDDEAEEPNLVPVETFACDFNDAQGPADLQKVIGEWNGWMDDRATHDYFAATLTPYYFGELVFDIAWLGAWIDGDAMGAGTDNWLEFGGELGAKFAKVLTCSSHTNFVSMRVKKGVPNDDESDKSFVITFENCSMEDDKTFDDYLAAQNEWNAYQDEHGFVGSAYAMFPIFGETDDSYDFKAVSTVDDHTAFGHNYKLMSEGHWRKSAELFDDLLDCDSGRVYNAKVVREIPSDEDE